MNDLQSEEPSEAVISLAILVEAALTSDSLGRHLQPSGMGIRDAWKYLRREVHQLLCTDTAKYRDARAAFKTTSKPAIALLAAHLASALGTGPQTAVAMASLALMVPLEIATNAWCASYLEGESPDNEVQALRRIRSRKAGNTSAEK